MNIFISHGHDELAKLKLKEFIRESLKFNPLVLADQPSDGMTIVEKLERYGKQSQFALIILTADDETTNGGLRARQNVIHELGYFQGLLGRNKVLLLQEKGIEQFSNISGIVYEEFPKGQIEATFEGIRKALQSTGAISIPFDTPVFNPPIQEPKHSKSIKDSFNKVETVFNNIGGSVNITSTKK